MSFGVVDEIFNEITFGGQADSRSNGALAVAGVDLRLEQDDFAISFKVIVAHHQGVRGLGTAHGAVSEIEFSHRYPPPVGSSDAASY